MRRGDLSPHCLYIYVCVLFVGHFRLLDHVTGWLALASQPTTLFTIRPCGIWD